MVNRGPYIGVWGVPVSAAGKIDAHSNHRDRQAAPSTVRVDPARALTLDFLRWIAGGMRSYADVMDAWRTSCPRLSIWEDAVEAGLVRPERRPEDGGQIVVTLTARGRALLTDAG